MRKKLLFSLLALALLLAGCGESAPASTTAPANLSPATAGSRLTAGNLPASPVATLSATATPVPVPTTAAASPTPPPPTATPVPPFQPALKQVGPAGCCADFTFAADGRLLFFEKPAGDNREGSWALDPASGQKTFLAPGPGAFSADLSLAALTNRGAGTARLQDLATNKSLGTLTYRGSPVTFSPDKKQVAYLLRSLQQDGPEAPQRFELWVAGSDGANARAIWSGRELANLQWFPDSRRLLLTGRDPANRRAGLWSIEAASGADTLLVDSKGLWNAALSPDGEWLAWAILLQGQERSGTWLGRADGSQARRLEWTGGFRWAGAHELFYLPVRAAGESSFELWSYDPPSAKAARLTGPPQTPLQVALDQWQVAPDGRGLAFRNAADNALWWLAFRP